MDFFKFLLTKHFLKHLVILVVLIILFFIALSFWLKSYTKHGEYITVPDFTGLMYDEIEDFASQRDLIPLIIDSVYDNTKVKGSIIGQDPPPDQLVKKNRKIYLTIVSLSQEMVRMPDLKDLTLRQAISSLDVYGLKTGRLKFIPHIAMNAVLSQEYKGKEIEPGTLIEKGSTINLVVGQGIRNEKTPLPFLIGKTREEAIELLKLSSLNVGGEFYEAGADESKAYVVKQRPVFTEGAFVNFGTAVDLWYKPALDFDINIIQQMLLQEESLNSIESEEIQ
ncbi:MAG: PASTA domain-containing protein [Bacteroidales bacterium]|nr:PASTA domain-containing protein [Bacteroidales bacterium]